MIETPREARRRNVRVAVMSRLEEARMPRVAVGLAGALVVVAGLLLTVVAKGIHDEPKVHDLAPGSSLDERVWNAFSSESQRVTAARTTCGPLAVRAERGGELGRPGHDNWG
jgi:hypothetical protein